MNSIRHEEIESYVSTNALTPKSISHDVIESSNLTEEKYREDKEIDHER